MIMFSPSSGCLPATIGTAIASLRLFCWLSDYPDQNQILGSPWQLLNIMKKNIWTSNSSILVWLFPTLGSSWNLVVNWNCFIGQWLTSPQHSESLSPFAFDYCWFSLSQELESCSAGKNPVEYSVRVRCHSAITVSKILMHVRTPW